MVRRRLTAARERGVKNLWLGSSLDGLEEVHDEVRGQKGAFQGLMETAAMVRREFPGLDFSFSFTITPRNYRQLWATYQHVKQMGLWFGAQMVVNHQGFDAPETSIWSKAQLDRVAEQLDAILLDICRSEGAVKKLLAGDQKESLWLWTRLLYWRYLRKYGEKPERFFKDCLAGQRYAMFDPEGKLFFCPVNKHRVIGDAKVKGFDALWTSKSAAAERRFVDSCKCDCWLNCIANPILDRAVALGQ
jgi:MoaA/NifB/PqqE/SkfB family radical SAM enzyme